MASFSKEREKHTCDRGSCLTHINTIQKHDQAILLAVLCERPGNGRICGLQKGPFNAPCLELKRPSQPL